MKKILLLLSIFSSQLCFPQGSIYISSVNHNPIWAGDSLILYFTAFGSGWGNDTGTVNIVIDGNIVSSKLVIDIPQGSQQWKILFPNLNDSGILIRFISNDGSAYDGFYIQIDNTLDVPETFSLKFISSKRYFSITGVEQSHVSGVQIEECKYSDGTISRRKVFIE